MSHHLFADGQTRKTPRQRIVMLPLVSALGAHTLPLLAPTLIVIIDTDSSEVLRPFFYSILHTAAVQLVWFSLSGAAELFFSCATSLRPRHTERIRQRHHVLTASRGFVGFSTLSAEGHDHLCTEVVAVPNSELAPLSDRPREALAALLSLRAVILTQTPPQ